MSERINVTFTDEKYSKIDAIAEDENSDWSSKAEYIRTHMIAGESDLPELDPRTNSFDEDDSFDPEKEILEGLTTEYQEVDEALDNAIDELAEILEKMADSNDSPVEKKTRKGFRVKE